VRLIQPRPKWTRRLVPDDERVRLPFPVHHVLYRHPHHAGASGYDRLCDFVGEEIQVNPALYYAGETLLRPWALLDARFGGHFEYSRYDWVLERALMSAMRKERGALFHVLYGEKNFRHSWKLAGVNGNKLIATLHHPAEHYEWLFRSTRHLGFLSHAIVMSEALRAFAEDLVGKGRVSVVPYGVDVNYFKPIARRRDGKVPRLVFAGFHERDYDALSHIVQALMSAHDTAEFVMISRDSRCEQIARRFPARTRCVAQLSDDDYLAALQTSDLMVLPLKRSVACTAVLEALACGVPVLTNDGGIRDYVGKAGILCEVGDSSGMADAALSLLRDAHSLEQMQAAARERALAFAWPLIARRTVDVYHSVMCQ